MNVPKIDLTTNAPVFGWQEIHEIVYLRCPRGHLAQLNHLIDLEGRVTPSVMCPKSGCDFHETIVLEGYNALDR